MKTLMLTAMHSGAGKTVMSCAVMAALKKRGARVQAFKCGPDYIDPMFHSRVLGVPSRNLDLFLQGEAGVRMTLSRADADVAVLEGAMGYYDGLNGTDTASAYAVSRLLKTPAILVLLPKGQGLTLAAQVRGMLDFRPESRIEALLLTNCTSSTASSLGPILTRETGLPVLEKLCAMPEISLNQQDSNGYTALIKCAVQRYNRKKAGKKCDYVEALYRYLLKIDGVDTRIRDRENRTAKDWWDMGNALEEGEMRGD